MRTTDSPAITAHARCDFCSKRPVVRLFPCASFPVPGAPAMSEGGWAACEGCAALVEAEAFDSLLLRGALSASLLTGADVEMAKEMLRPIYETFFRLRKVVPHV